MKPYESPNTRDHVGTVRVFDDAVKLVLMSQTVVEASKCLFVVIKEHAQQHCPKQLTILLDDMTLARVAVNWMIERSTLVNPRP